MSSPFALNCYEMYFSQVVGGHEYLIMSTKHRLFNTQSV